jgi:acyl-CoA oxidase
VRDDSHKIMSGVTIREMGIKMGLNGVDNGSLLFDNVRIPRENMMNKYGDVDANGNFSSEVAHIPSRFFKVTERLVSGRVCIASMAMGATRACLFVGIKYAMQRLAVGSTGKSDTPIFNY